MPSAMCLGHWRELNTSVEIYRCRVCGNSVSLGNLRDFLDGNAQRLSYTCAFNGDLLCMDAQSLCDFFSPLVFIVLCECFTLGNGGCLLRS